MHILTSCSFVRRFRSREPGNLLACTFNISNTTAFFDVDDPPFVRARGESFGDYYGAVYWIIVAGEFLEIEHNDSNVRIFSDFLS